MDKHEPGDFQKDESKDAKAEAAYDGSNRENAPGSKPSKLKELWQKTGLNFFIIFMMFKSSIAPTIGLAMYQADVVATEFGNLGYLVAIASILGFPIIPRAKFVQTILLDVIAVCLGSAWALLAIYTAVQARLNTTAPGESSLGFNSSASAVCATWLFFQIYLVNALRSARPQLQFPAIIFSIFVDIAMVYAPRFPNMDTGISFILQLMKAFLTGLALSVGVAFVVLPITSRQSSFGTITAELNAFRASWKAYMVYVKAFEKDNLFIPQPPAKSPGKNRWWQSKDRTEPKPTPKPAVKDVKDAIAETRVQHGKLQADLTFAKRELAYAKLDGSDIAEISRLLRYIMVPIIGLGSFVDIFQRIAESQQWDKLDLSDNEFESEVVRESSARSFAEWQKIMKTLHEPFEKITAAMDDAVEHILLTLELKKPAKKKTKKQGKNSGTDSDIESKGEAVVPGDRAFAGWYAEQTDKFYQSRVVSIRHWCEEKNTDVPSDMFTTQFMPWPENRNEGIFSNTKSRDQRQIYLILYVESMLHSTSTSVLSLVHFAESKVASGCMSKNRLIQPPLHRLKKWLHSVFSEEDDTPNTDHRTMAELSTPTSTNLGPALNNAFRKKDPEHLPATNIWQRLGNTIRVFPRLMRSPHSQFGFRAACATMSIAIIAYLRDSADFFNVSSASNFLLRVVGSVLAMLASYVIYYIVDGHTPGVIVFLFLWIFSNFYIVLKHPKYAVVGMISAITPVLIIGFELQAQKLGIEATEASGQVYYPPYEFAPYRVAVVAGGLLVAYFWTVFPYPITEHGELRRETGEATFLLSCLCAVVRETVREKVAKGHLGEDNGDSENTNGGRAGGGSGGGESTSEGSHAGRRSSTTSHESQGGIKPFGGKSPGGQDHRGKESIDRLPKTRLKLFTKTSSLVTQLRQSSEFTRWQISIGGKFPKETYDGIIGGVEKVLESVALVGFAGGLFVKGGGGGGLGGRDNTGVSDGERGRDTTGKGHGAHDQATEKEEEVTEGDAPEPSSTRILESNIIASKQNTTTAPPTSESTQQQQPPNRTYSHQHESSNNDNTTTTHTQSQSQKQTQSQTHQAITTRLALLSNSLLTAQPLPPYLPHLRPFETGAENDSLHSVTPSTSNPHLAAHAVCQVAGAVAVEELNRLTALVRELVGELDFGFGVGGSGGGGGGGKGGFGGGKKTGKNGKRKVGKRD
ncbi:MAG: hypothetical protein M1831_004266 [Alyxoria varia]|nr:MAG: hypothetical protein M1831_004266 [Alyxoria varia]